MSNGTIIYGSTMKRASEKFDELVKFIKEEDIAELRRSRFTQWLKLKDGSIYKTVVSNSNARGYRWNYAYVDRDIKVGDFIEVILPAGKEGSAYEFF